MRKSSVTTHPAGTSKESDICDLSNISDMTICIVGNGNIHIFNDPAYLSTDLWNIYVEKCNKVWRSDLCWDIYGSNKDDPDN